MKLTMSVAMATYNGAAYIGTQLESIASQSRLPDEIVIGDDGSSDATLEIVDAFARRTGIVSVRINHERLGSTRNFEQVLSRCTGDIIALSDQDDIWRPDKLQVIERAFLDNPDAPYAFSNGSLMDSAGLVIPGSLWQRVLFLRKEQELYRSGRGVEVLLRRNVITGAAMALRRSALAAALPIAPGWVHDYWVAFVLESLGRGVIIDEPLLSYRRHSAQQIGVLKFSPASVAKVFLRQDDQYCAREAATCDALADRLEKIGAPRLVIISVRDKARFLRRRSLMRIHPASAPTWILQSWWAGDYHRFSPELAHLRLAIAADAVTSVASALRIGRPHARLDQLGGVLARIQTATRRFRR